MDAAYCKVLIQKFTIRAEDPLPSAHNVSNSILSVRAMDSQLPYLALAEQLWVAMLQLQTALALGAAAVLFKPGLNAPGTEDMGTNTVLLVVVTPKWNDRIALDPATEDTEEGFVEVIREWENVSVETKVPSLSCQQSPKSGH